MRVVFLSPAAGLGGAERCLIDCVATLREAEPLVELSLVCFAEGPLVARARALGVEVEVIAPPRALTELGESAGTRGLGSLLDQACSAPGTVRFMNQVRLAIAQKRPQVVHSNGIKAHIVAGLLAPWRARVVVHLHDFVGSRQVSKHLLPVLARTRSRSVFIANSLAVARDFRRLSPSADIRTVYNVVDTAYFSPGDSEAVWLAARAELEPPSAAVVAYGLVATYARWKGHAVFIEAAGRLQRAFPDRQFRFYIVGGPIYATPGSQVNASELWDRAEKSGIADSFGLVPFEDDIARVYRSLNVVVHASTKPEPFGRSIVEAMACARPVIVSSAGGAAELFQHGENAVGFPPGDAVGLSAAMTVLLDQNERVRLGRAAREHAVLAFGRPRLGGQLLSVYRA